MGRTAGCRLPPARWRRVRAAAPPSRDPVRWRANPAGAPPPLGSPADGGLLDATGVHHAERLDGHSARSSTQKETDSVFGIRAAICF